MKGKLVIFDSNADFLPKEVTGNDLWLHRQRALVVYLKKSMVTILMFGLVEEGK